MAASYQPDKWEKSWKCSSEKNARSRWPPTPRAWSSERWECAVSLPPWSSFPLCFLCFMRDKVLSVGPFIWALRRYFQLSERIQEKQTRRVWLPLKADFFSALWSPKCYVANTWLILRGEGPAYRTTQFSCRQSEGTVTSHRLTSQSHKTDSHFR